MVIPTANRLNEVEEYFFSKKLREVSKLNAQGRRVLNLAIGNPDLAPSQPTTAALSNAARQKDNHGYQPYNGIDDLRTAIADWYQRIYHVTLRPDSQVLPLLGSKEGIFHISMAFLNPDDRVLVPDPGYPAYSAATKMVNAQPVFYDLKHENGWLPDLDALEATDLSRVKMMWLNYPHMPTGALAAKEDFQKLVAFAHEKKILICHDNPYSLILNSKTPLSILQIERAFDCCLELNSLSKSHHMAGWRVGMVLGKGDYLQAILTVKSNIDSGMFLPVQTAACEALQNSVAWHLKQNQIYHKRRQLLFRLMDIMNFTYSEDTAGLFVWAKAPEQVKDVPAFLDELLYTTGVFLTPGIIFGENGKRFVRASICVKENVITEAMERITAHLKVQL